MASEEEADRDEGGYRMSSFSSARRREGKGARSTLFEGDVGLTNS